LRIAENLIQRAFVTGKEWSEFAVQEGRQWAMRYKLYVERRHPVMIVSYNELEDRHTIQPVLLRLSNFLRVPVRKSALECIMRHANDFPLKPRPLKSGFQPFRLLLPKYVVELQALENKTQVMISGLRAMYRPNVWNHYYHYFHILMACFSGTTPDLAWLLAPPKGLRKTNVWWCWNGTFYMPVLLKG